MTLDTALSACGNRDEAQALLASLVAMKSYPGEEGPVQQIVFDWMQANGLKKKALRADKTYQIPREGPAGPSEPTPIPPRRMPPARPPTGAVASR